MTYELFIPVLPLAKQGDRVRVVNGIAMHYTAADVKRNAEELRKQAAARWRKPAWYGPLKVDYLVQYPYRKSEPQKNRTRSILKDTKPDVDNLAKNLNDAFEGVLWESDAKIVALSIRKVWTDQEGVQIRMETL